MATKKKNGKLTSLTAYIALFDAKNMTPAAGRTLDASLSDVQSPGTSSLQGQMLF